MMSAYSHPEQLLDRARQGALDPAEQATLERHLAACAVCSAQLSLAPRFDHELLPQALDQALDQHAVEAAMLRMRGAPPALRRASPTRFRWAAAALVVFGAAGAAAVIGRRSTPRPVSPSPAPAVESPAARAPLRPIEAAPAEAPAPAESSPAKAAPAQVAPAITAEALFERAEKLRREGRVEGAVATYRRLQAAFPDTAEAQLSSALAGQLLLKQGRPADALAQFDRHLKLGGEVGEEALAGRATALEQLHRTADAIAAWKSLLARYPGSVYAGRAGARLDELGERR